MASYAELFDLRSNDQLRNRVAVAVAVKAHALLSLPSPTAAQVAWAREAVADPAGKAGGLFVYVLAANRAATAAQILAATDAAIQANVDAAVDVLVSGGA